LIFRQRARERIDYFAITPYYFDFHFIIFATFSHYYQKKKKKKEKEKRFSFSITPIIFRFFAAISLPSRPFTPGELPIFAMLFAVLH
jgi:hypothetical protein